MLPKFGSTTYVNPHSLLYYRMHRMTLAENSPASSVPPPFYLHSSFSPFPLSATGCTTFSVQLGLVSLAFPPPVTLETRTFPISPRASHTPSPPSPSFPQSRKPRPSLLLIYFPPPLPSPPGP